MAAALRSSAFTPRTQALGGRSSSASKWTSCDAAWTPASVRPAAAVATRCAAIEPSACSSASCTLQDDGCDCQPQNASPAYSMANAMRIRVHSKDSGGESIDPPPVLTEIEESAELRQQRLRFHFLLVVALVQHFLQNFAGAFDVAHFLICLGEIELRCGVVPLAVEH